MYFLNLLDYFMLAVVKFILIGIVRDRTAKGAIPRGFIEKNAHEVSDAHQVLDAPHLIMMPIPGVPLR
jgi:hypothetical protein